MSRIYGRLYLSAILKYALRIRTTADDISKTVVALNHILALFPFLFYLQKINSNANGIPQMYPICIAKRSRFGRLHFKQILTFVSCYLTSFVFCPGRIDDVPAAVLV